MEEKPLAPIWFIQTMALLAVAGMTIPLVAGVAGFIDQLIGVTSMGWFFEMNSASNDCTVSTSSIK